ncbi:MAG: tetratricopeptide repeat protein [Verrucomicrobia bacterium]|nr:tetratricopeptide repeat protein [Verrucomicrobiota bacterium]
MIRSPIRLGRTLTVTWLLGGLALASSHPTRGLEAPATTTRPPLAALASVQPTLPAPTELLSAPYLTTVSTNHPAVLATNRLAVSETNEASLIPVSPALIESAPIVNTGTLRNPLHAPDVEDRIESCRLQLEAARQLRRENRTAEATALLTTVIGNPVATEELKRQALLELAVAAHQAGLLARAQYLYADYVHRHPGDANVPEVLLRQGLLYREMGAHTNALNKFFGVLSSSLAVKYERLDYYQRLVLQAQAEIAETHLLQGRYDEAVFNLQRLLKLESPHLNRSRVRFKLLQALAQLERDAEVIAQGTEFLRAHPGEAEEPEVRFLLATSFKRLGRNQEALVQVLQLLASQANNPDLPPEQWRYWQQRTGNDLANRLYQEGDYQSALLVYQQLAKVSSAPAWQLPVVYQIGLVFEKLKQPARAYEQYDQILTQAPALSTNAPNPNLQMLIDMAKWRRGFIMWQTNAELASQPILLSASTTNAVAQLP